MGATPKAPDGLLTPGLHTWNSVLAACAPGWELDERDLLVLEEAARQADLIARLEDSITLEGLVVKGAAGQDRLNAAVPALNVARGVLARLLAQVETRPPAAKTGHLNSRQRTDLHRANLREASRGAS